MKVVAAYLLAVLGGNIHPSIDNIKSILGSVGVEVEDERIELLLSQVKGKDFEELIACGREKLASVPSGGSEIPVSTCDGAATVAAAASVGAAEPVKEDKKEVVEESDEEMCFSLFD